MTRNDLIVSALKWEEKAKKDIREFIEAYMENTGINEADFAYKIGVGEDAIVRILRGDGKFTVDTLTKLLIASGYALRIEPVADTPMFEEFGEPILDLNALRSTNEKYEISEDDFDEMPVDDTFDYLSDDEIDEQVKKNQEDARRFANSEKAKKQPRDENGRFCCKKEECDDCLGKMTREELINIIKEKALTGLIDPYLETRKTLADFLKTHLDECKGKACPSYGIDDKVLELKDRIKKTLEDNPNLERFFRMLVG